MLGPRFLRSRRARFNVRGRTSTHPDLILFGVRVVFGVNPRLYGMLDRGLHIADPFWAIIATAFDLG